MSRPDKRPRLLEATEISELVVDTNSDEARDSNDVSSVEGGSESVPGVSQPQPYRQTSSFHKSSSSISSSASDEGDAGDSEPGEQTQQPVSAVDTLLLPSEQCSTHIHRRPQRKEGQ